MMRGNHVRLREATEADLPRLGEIRAEPEVFARWGGEPDDLTDEDVHIYVIEYEDRVVGAIQWSEEEDPDYRHAGIDIYLDPAVHGRGLGTDAVRTLATHL